MLRIMAAAAVLAVGATIVLAQNVDAIKQRQAEMKSQQAAGKAITAMVKGEAPFDLAKAQASLAVFSQTTAKLKTLFPDDSKTGAETYALPAIWENKADFLSRLDKLAADAKAAGAAVKDLDSLKANAGKVFANCGECHKKYQKQ